MDGATVADLKESTEGYVIFFPEDLGYLYCDQLATGEENSIQLVYSLAGEGHCMRRKTIPTCRNDEASPHRQVKFHPKHDRIPRLISYKDYDVLPRSDPIFGKIKSTTIISTLCNGGSLGSYRESLRRAQTAPPEVFLWQYFEQSLDMLAHLHNGENAIAHADAHLGNVHLHFPTAESKLPDLYLADFSCARKIDNAIWEHPPTGSQQLRDGRQLSASEAAEHEADLLAIASDFHRLYKNLRELMPCMQQEQSVHTLPAQPAIEKQPETVTNARGTIGPDDLYQCLLGLKTLYTGLHLNWKKYTLFHALRATVKSGAALARALDAGKTDLRNLRLSHPRDPSTLQEAPAVRMRIAVFRTRNALFSLAQNIAGPWRVARLCTSSARILGVEKLNYNLHLPRAMGVGFNLLPMLADQFELEALKAKSAEYDALEGDDGAGAQHSITIQEGDQASLQTVTVTLDEMFGLDPSWAEVMAMIFKSKPKILLSRPR